MIESTTEKLKLEVDGTTAVVTIDNPSANVWDAESLEGLRDLVLGLNEEKGIYALVVTGQGEKFFSAGADLNVFADGDKANARLMARRFGEAFERAAGVARGHRGSAALWRRHSEPGLDRRRGMGEAHDPLRRARGRRHGAAHRSRRADRGSW
jgi:enoyl-CoA hydratase/carnithine racemase